MLKIFLSVKLLNLFFAELISVTTAGEYHLLSDKVIVITGGCGYLGQHFCQSVITQNGHVIIADIDPEKGEQLALELNVLAKKNNSSARAEFYHLDICNLESLQVLINQLAQKFNRIDAVVNNAYPRNKNYGAKFLDVKYEDFCDNLNINLGGYFLTSQQFSHYFSQQGYGNIINIASIYGVIAPKFELYQETIMTMPVEYAAIKSGLIHLTKYMAKELKGKHIRVNALSPGGILDAQPQSFLDKYKQNSLNKGMLSPEDICGSLIYLLSDASTFVNGQNIIVDDGFTL